MNQLLKRCAAVVIGATMLSSCQAMGRAPKVFDVSGQAIDVTTGKPLAGVWIVAKYRRAGGTTFAQNAIWCVKTVGMYTDAQGRFGFTYEEGREPDLLFIKPGYYREDKWQYVNGIPQAFPRPMEYKNYDKDYPSPHQHVNVYLRPQNPAARKYEYGDAQICDRATSLADVEPMVTFFNIEMAEYERYGENQGLISSQRETIELQKRLVYTNQKNKSK